MNAVKVVATLAQKDAGKARSEGQEALRKLVLEWLCGLHKLAADSAAKFKGALFEELAVRAPHMEHEAAVRVVDFYYGYLANTRAVLGALRGMIEKAEQEGKPSEGGEP